jgi:glycosyltransferase involved in cell wall biosynthesis
MELQQRSLVTFAIISYNQAQYIIEAVQSALDQRYSPLEIVISDDCSTDGTYELIQQLVAKYCGPHNIIVNRNQPNLGLAGNVNKVWELSSGELVVFQAGDDVSLPNRTTRLVEGWLSRTPRPDLVYSGVTLTDEHGTPIGERTGVLSCQPKYEDTITGKHPFVAGGCAAAYSRKLHYFIGPLNEGVIAEDFVYSLRALLGDGVVGLPDKLVNYRQHGQSIIGGLRFGVPSERYLRGHLALLHEYRRAMDAYQVRSWFLHWKLRRQIESTKREIDSLNDGRIGNFLSMMWALVTFRPRFMLAKLKCLVRR